MVFLNRLSMQLLSARHQELISLDILSFQKKVNLRRMNTLNRSQRAANDLMRMKIVDFDTSKRQFPYAIF